MTALPQLPHARRIASVARCAALGAIVLLADAAASRGAVVQYSHRASYFSATYTASGGIYDQGTTEVGMWASSATGYSVGWRQFRVSARSPPAPSLQRLRTSRHSAEGESSQHGSASSCATSLALAVRAGSESRRWSPAGTPGGRFSLIEAGVAAGRLVLHRAVERQCYLVMPRFRLASGQCRVAEDFALHW